MWQQEAEKHEGETPNARTNETTEGTLTRGDYKHLG